MTRLLSYGLALALCLTVGATTYLMAPRRVVETEGLPALTYDTPIKVLTKSVSAGEPFTLESTRCNNTAGDLAVQITIWWQDSAGHLTPYQTVVNGVLTGPRFDTVVPSGCREDYQTTNPFPAGLPEEIYDLRGQVCYGGVALIDVPFTCVGWRTETFHVVGEVPQ